TVGLLAAQRGPAAGGAAPPGARTTYRHRLATRPPPGADRRAPVADRQAPGAGTVLGPADAGAPPQRPAGRRPGRLPGGGRLPRRRAGHRPRRAAPPAAPGDAAQRS